MTKTKLTKKESNEIKHFNLMASNYDKNYGYDDRFTLYKINKKIKEFKMLVDKNISTKKFRIVEMGCGTGEYTKLIAKMYPFAEIMALDISDDILAIARDKCKKYKNVQFLNKSAYSTGLKKNSIDVVYGFYFLHHVDLKRVNDEIYRLLKNGGVAFFYEPNILNPLVYLIKSNKFLKSRFGDSPDEWAINPLTIGKIFSKFEVTTKTTEFIYPVTFVGEKVMTYLDRISTIFSYIPLIQYLGGSVAIKIIK